MSHVPERTCVGCRTKRPKTQLLRVVRSANSAELDLLARKPGRGAYFCRQPSCWQAGIQKRGLDRTLRAALAGPERQRLLHALDTMGDK